MFKRMCTGLNAPEPGAESGPQALHPRSAPTAAQPAGPTAAQPAGPTATQPAGPTADERPGRQPQSQLRHAPLLRAISPNRWALGLGVRSWVVRSTAMMPNLGPYPKIHSKLSIADQHM